MLLSLLALVTAAPPVAQLEKYAPAQAAGFSLVDLRSTNANQLPTVKAHYTSNDVTVELFIISEEGFPMSYGKADWPGCAVKGKPPTAIVRCPKSRGTYQAATYWSLDGLTFSVMVMNPSAVSQANAVRAVDEVAAAAVAWATKTLAGQLTDAERNAARDARAAARKK